MSVAIRGIHREYARLQGHVHANVKTKKKAKKDKKRRTNQNWTRSKTASLAQAHLSSRNLPAVFAHYLHDHRKMSAVFYDELCAERSEIVRIIDEAPALSGVR